MRASVEVARAPQLADDTSTVADVLDLRWPVMGGTAHVRLVGGSASALQRARRWSRELEQLWSRFIESSEVSQLNAGSGRRRVRPETARLVRGMIEAWHSTEGRYDPTMLPAIVDLGYAQSTVDSRRTTSLPPGHDPRGNPGGIIVDDEWVELPRGTTIDPGGIGKGLAADIIAERLINEGAAGCLVEFSGDLRVMGTPPDGVAWRIAIEDPFDVSHQRGIVRLRDGGVATSSQRKRRWTGPDGAPRHHLLDPTTTLPASTRIETATVLATSAMRAEFLTKPCFLLTPETALSAIPHHGAAAMLIDANGIELVTENWKAYS